MWSFLRRHPSVPKSYFYPFYLSLILFYSLWILHLFLLFCFGYLVLLSRKSTLSHKDIVKDTHSAQNKNVFRVKGFVIIVLKKFGDVRGVQPVSYKPRTFYA